MGQPAIGLDFGTTNCALAWVGEDGEPVLARFASDLAETSTFRSILYFEPQEDGRPPISTHAGPRAIERYLAAEEKTGRLMQSLKSFLASRLFRSTSVFGTSRRLEELIGLLLVALREAAQAELGHSIERVVVGRPVQFVRGSDADDQELALTRLAAALRNAGFRELRFEYEPVAAAYHYERRLETDQLVMIGDFGGGTSDFSLIRVGPGFRDRAGRGEGRRDGILGHAGVGVAGDAFDGKLVRHLVAPHLGRGTEFRSCFDRVLPVPAWIYTQLERWHHVSFLRSRKTLQLLLDLRREALEPEALEALLHVVEHDLGFLLFRAVEEAKRTLSSQPEARFHFEHEDLVIEETVTRARFESWIAEEIRSIAAAVDDLLARVDLPRARVDRVFLTGGSSFVPAVRGIFEERFGAERLRFGGELTSVASGLALRAREA